MLFASSIFIFGFLPLVLLLYYICRKNRKLSNIILLIASLGFYAFGEPKFVFIMVISIIMNWAVGLSLAKLDAASVSTKNISAADALQNAANLLKKAIIKRKAVLIIGVILNLSVIFIFKYLMFTMNIVNNITPLSFEIPLIKLPIGISFYTFQSISYLVDVYRGDGKAQKSLLNVALYISFFPQLIAGPIVRYETIADQLENRKETLDKFSEGVRRFIVGLGKKVLIANQMAIIADAVFADAALGAISVKYAWLGIIAYTFQIFFDFSGYSDMAIGLGKMFGFEFLENFNYPYISTSITEFWRRWHISLSTWFRDYVYIPLGGSRVNKTSRRIFNIFIVWFLTGMWHGASWNFIIWGLYYFILLIIEKFAFPSIKKRKTSEEPANNYIAFIKNLLGHVYTMFFVMIGWLIFRAETATLTLSYLKSAFGLTGHLAAGVAAENNFYLFTNEKAAFLILAAIFSTPVIRLAEEKIEQTFKKARDIDSKKAVNQITEIDKTSAIIPVNLMNAMNIVYSICSSGIYILLLMVTISFC